MERKLGAGERPDPGIDGVLAVQAPGRGQRGCVGELDLPVRGAVFLRDEQRGDEPGGRATELLRAALKSVSPVTGAHAFSSLLSSLKNRQSVPCAMIFCGPFLIMPISFRRSE